MRIEQHLLLISSLVVLNLSSSWAQEKDWNDFLEPEFPFFGTSLDARDVSKNAGITPRGIILKAGSGVHACFDPDLLRFSLVWQAEEGASPITLNGMAPGSYHDANKKSNGGQKSLPKPIGKVILETAVHPGWFVGELPEEVEDPRPAPADEAEVGRGPISTPGFRFNGIRLEDNRFCKTAMLKYSIHGVEVIDRFGFVEAEKGKWKLVRDIAVGPRAELLTCVVGWNQNGLQTVEFPPSEEAEGILVDISVESNTPPKDSHVDWLSTVTTQAKLSEANQTYVIDEIPTPLTNPWKRNVRISALDFFSDGRAAVSTFDGDVWLISGLSRDMSEVTWKRFASGLQEPMGLQIVNDQIYVFGRTCIWRLVDENDDEECDFYENFCNLVGQTAESREFPNDFVKIPEGGFYIAKPGQLGDTRGHHNGTICKIAADGKSFEVIARGFRQPFIGYDAKRDLLTASDQQGNWVPTTPIHAVQKGAHYGFLPLMETEHPEEIGKPLVWAPHFVNQSGASQITNHDPRFGPLTSQLIHIGFNRPELFCIYRDGNQGAISPFLSGFGTGTLKAAVNPLDGQLYICGFKIWGTIAKETTGFYRVRHTGKSTLQVPAEVRSAKKGVLLKFHAPLNEALATHLASYEVDRWNYKRTSGYGSGHYKLDGKPGQETLNVSSVYLSDDKMSVFLGIPDMKKVQQMRVTYRLALPTELPQIQSTYLTVHELKDLDLLSAGFGKIEVDLTPPDSTKESKKIATLEEGQKLYTAVGCNVCHTIDGSKAPEKPGPTWLGLYKSRRNFTDGGLIKSADEVYLRESILNPGRRITEGFDGDDVKMPAYLGVLQDHQVDSLILYIKSLVK